MTAPAATRQSAAPPERVLRRLFLILFLRGRTSRGIDQLKRKGLPTSIGKRLGVTLGFYALFGCIAFMMVGQPVFALATYLHAMTFVLLGMYVATSAGEVLFNREEADILLHRPITPRALLRARISMLVQVSLWIAGAFNLAGLLAGAGARDGGPLFVPVHAVSTTLLAIFTTATVVVTYQLCLRWFGREKLDALMTATQVIVAIAVVLGGQIVPQVMFRLEVLELVMVNSWWTMLLPPAWFAGIDDALAGTGAPAAWRLASLGLLATAAVVWLALSRLAGDYNTGLQTIAESPVHRTVRARRRRVMDWLVTVPPLSWWLRDSVSRAAFLLSASYLWRDRDIKLRVYPGIAPILVLPLVFMLPRGGDSTDLFSGVAFGAAYMALVPMMTLGMLEFSQQWQAADIFRLAPIIGPAALCHGARRAVLSLIAFPAMVIYAGVVLLVGAKPSDLVMLLPALMSIPVFGMIPCLGGHAVPFSRPTEMHKGAMRGLYVVGAMFAAMTMSLLAAVARHAGFLGVVLLGETVLATVIYTRMRASVERVRWASLE